VRLDGNFRLLTAQYQRLRGDIPNFLAPDGRVFGYDTNGNMYYVSTAGTGSLSAAGVPVGERRLDIECRVLRHRQDSADWRQFSRRSDHRHQWPDAGLYHHGADGLATPMGECDRTGGRQGPWYRRQPERRHVSAAK
jgi:hypothetical protein